MPLQTVREGQQQSPSSREEKIWRDELEEEEEEEEEGEEGRQLERK